MEAEQLECPDTAPKIENPTYSIISFPSSKLPESYKGFVFQKWLKSLRYGNRLLKKMPAEEYYDKYSKYIENLFSKPDSIVRFAVLSDDHDVVLGFASSREDVLDFIYVHADYRKTGIGEKLLSKGISTFTHMTRTAMNIWQDEKKDIFDAQGKYIRTEIIKISRFKYLKFNPFA